MRILQVNFSDLLGGAQIVSRRLAAGYEARGHPSHLVVGFKNSDDDDVRAMPRDTLRRRLTRPVREIRTRRGEEDFDFPATARLLDLAPWPPDLLHLHNLHGGYFDLRRLPELTAQVPSVVTLHDSWLMTGHCAHTLDSDKWRTGCGECPHLDTYPAVPRDRTAFNWARKREIYRRSRLHVATPAKWLADRVPESILAEAAVEVRVIPQGVDLNLFRPGNRARARLELGLDPEPFVALFAADFTRTNWAKDVPTLERAIEEVAARAKRPVLLLCVGEEAPDRELAGGKIRFLAHTGSPEKLVSHYRAADVYLHAAHADTYPNTVVEALACGIPVIATAVGGIPEQVEEGVNGHLIPPGDGHAMAERVLALASDEERRAPLGRTAAEGAARTLDFERTVDAYVEWFSEIAERGYSRSSSIPESSRIRTR